AWPVNPNAFVAPGVSAAAYDVKPMKDHEWNLSVQKTFPFQTAVTVSYVGSKGTGLIVDNSLNSSSVTVSYVGSKGTGLIVDNSLNNVPPGLYTNLQAAKP